jgi:hypothetical protein
MTPYSRSTRHATHVYLRLLIWAGLTWLDIPHTRTHRTRNRRTAK